jgi:hypothetical protein
MRNKIHRSIEAMVYSAVSKCTDWLTGLIYICTYKSLKCSPILLLVILCFSDYIFSLYQISEDFFCQQSTIFRQNKGPVLQTTCKPLHSGVTNRSISLFIWINLSLRCTYVGCRMFSSS